MFTKLIIEKWNEWSVRWNKPCETWLYFTTPHWLSSFGGSRKDVLPIIIQYIVSLLFICQASLSYCSTWTREMYSSLDNNTRWWRCVCLAAARIPKRMRNVDQLDIIPGMLCVLFLNLFFFCIFYLLCFLYFHSAVLRSSDTDKRNAALNLLACLHVPAAHKKKNKKAAASQNSRPTKHGVCAWPFIPDPPPAAASD